MENKNLYDDLKKLTKRANQRLLRLERAERTDSDIYQSTVNDIENIYGLNGKNRFKLSKKTTPEELEIQKNYIENFLNSETSTVRGLKKNIKESTFFEGLPPNEKKLVERWGVKNFDKFYKIVNSTNFKRLSNIVGSQILVDFYVKNEGKSITKLNKAFADILSEMQNVENDGYLINLIEDFKI